MLILLSWVHPLIWISSFVGLDADWSLLSWMYSLTDGVVSSVDSNHPRQMLELMLVLDIYWLVPWILGYLFICFPFAGIFIYWFLLCLVKHMVFPLDVLCFDFFSFWFVIFLAHLFPSFPETSDKSVKCFIIKIILFYGGK